jgi:hypothetical protein
VATREKHWSIPQVKYENLLCGKRVLRRLRDPVHVCLLLLNRNFLLVSPTFRKFSHPYYGKSTRTSLCIYITFWLRSQALPMQLVGGKVKRKRNRPWRPLELREVEATTFSDTRLIKWSQGCQPYAPAAFYPQEDSWYLFQLETESIPGLYCEWKD